MFLVCYGLHKGDLCNLNVGKASVNSTTRKSPHINTGMTVELKSPTLNLALSKWSDFFLDDNPVTPICFTCIGQGSPDPCCE